VAFGDCSDEMELDIRKLLPKAVIDQYDMTPEMWIERIRKWWANNNGLSTYLPRKFQQKS
jgi:hypothetical protein